jgi:hypothetical protein
MEARSSRGEKGRRYIWAALTVVLAYRAAGLPGKLPGIGDPFEEWSDNVRSAWSGLATLIRLRR